MLGLIVTKSKNLNIPDFITVTDKPPVGCADVPTLVVGKKLAIELYGRERVRMLNREIDPDVYWTYTLLEKRSSHEKDIEEFLRYVIDEAIDRVEYRFFNIFTESYGRIRKLVKAMKTRRVKVVYVRGNHLYVYDGRKRVMGLSLSQMKYIGIDTDRLLSRMKESKHIWLIYRAGQVDEYTRLKLTANPFIVPYLYAEKNQVFK